MYHHLERLSQIGAGELVMISLMVHIGEATMALIRVVVMVIIKTIMETSMIRAVEGRSGTFPEIFVEGMSTCSNSNNQGLWERIL